MLYGLNSSQSYAAADIVCVMQLFVGRVAMLGFAAELIGEELTGETPFSSMSNISDVVTAVLLMLLHCPAMHPTCTWSQLRLTAASYIGCGTVFV